MNSADRAAYLVRLPRAKELQFADFCGALGDAFAGALVNLTGEAERDIVTLTSSLLDDPLCVYQGIAADGQVRLLGAVYSGKAEAAAIEVVIVATKLARVADWSAFGQSGPDVGNSVLVARAYDLTIETAVTHGVGVILNHPVNARVREIYTAMGFENGERLDLLQPTRIVRACGFIENAYVAAAARHHGFRRPW